MREQALLAQARVLTDKHEALSASTGQSFNLFSILGRETDEVRTHSAILAELLNPNGSHRQGAAFAILFASRFELDEEDIKHAQVRAEKAISTESRADIFMETGRPASSLRTRSTPRISRDSLSAITSMPPRTGGIREFST